jgi:hypothetical protein
VPSSQGWGINSLLVAPGTGNRFAQNHLDLIQQFAFGTALWQGFLVDAFFAGTFYQIADLEIVFIFEPFFCHFLKRLDSIILVIFKMICSSS